MTLTSEILARALNLGFNRAAVLPVGPPRYAAQFTAWLAAGHHGEMAYLAARAAERLDPLRLAPDASSMIVVAANYDPGPFPQPSGGPPQGRIARYALWPDYHDTLKPKLFALDAFIRERTGRQTLGKVFVDSAPVLERDYAEQAGLGFIGRNTCLITPGLGSWTFLAGLLVPEDLTPGPSPARRGVLRPPFRPNEEDWEIKCGRCTRCLDACPTRAFVGPHVLDARRCISYLTIELRGPIPRELRPRLGNWVFGCDVCQEVCPYNRARGPAVETAATSAARGPAVETAATSATRGPAVETAATSAKSTFVDSGPVGAGRLRNGSCDFQSPGFSPGFSPGCAPGYPALCDLLALDEAAFRARFRGTPVLRAKRRGLVRNACVAAGNSGDPALVPALLPLLADPEPLIRGHAAWALGQIGGAEALHALTGALSAEGDPWVREEIAAARAALEG